MAANTQCTRQNEPQRIFHTLRTAACECCYFGNDVSNYWAHISASSFEGMTWNLAVWGDLAKHGKRYGWASKKRQPKDELVCFLITVTAKWRMWLGWPTVATMFFLTWHPSSNNMTRHKMFLNSPCRCDSWNAQHGRWLWTCCFVSVVVGASAQDRRISPRQRWQKVHREAAEEHSAIWNLQNVVRWKSHI